MQTRYWESWVRPLLLVSREALSWQLIICLVSIKDAGLGLGLWLLTSLRHPSLRLREINFPLADEYLVKLHEPWAISPPGPVFVDSEWDEKGGWVTALMSRDGPCLSPEICFEYFDNVVQDYGCIPR